MAVQSMYARGCVPEVDVVAQSRWAGGCVAEVVPWLRSRDGRVVVRPKWFCGCVVELSSWLCGRSGSEVMWSRRACCDLLLWCPPGCNSPWTKLARS